jgi:hypothetical protein
MTIKVDVKVEVHAKVKIEISSKNQGGDVYVNVERKAHFVEVEGYI